MICTYMFVELGKLIQSEQDSKWLQIGIAAAMIDGGRGDYPDLIVSLVLLRFAAEMHGIDTQPFFDDFNPNC